MNLKKIILISLVLCILLSFSEMKVFAYSSNELKCSITEEKAEKISKELLKEYFNINITDDMEAYTEFIKGSICNVYWYYKKDKNKRIPEELETQIDLKTNKLIRMQNNINTFHQEFLPSFTFNEAKEKAENILKRINDKEFKETVINGDDDFYIYGNEYIFHYTRIVNSIEYEENGIGIGIDGYTGEVTRYGISWDENPKLPDAKKAMSMEKAQDILLNYLDLNLVYKKYDNIYRYQNKNNYKNMKLVYEIDQQQGIIDAISGVPIIWSNNSSCYNKVNLKLSEKKKNDILKKYKQINFIPIPVSEKQAEQIARKFVIENYGIGYKLDNRGLDLDEDFNPWKFYFEKVENQSEEATKTSIVEIKIKPYTEEIEFASMWYRLSNKKSDIESKKYNNVITLHQAYDKAVDFITEYHSDKLKNIEFNIVKDDCTSKYYSFIFGRKENNIICNDNYFRLEFYKDGKLKCMDNCWFYDAKFDKPEKIICKDEAINIIKKERPPYISYCSEGYKGKIWLAYSMNYLWEEVDAFKGDLLDIKGEKVNDNVNKDFLEKIKESEYEREIELLAAGRLIDIEDFQLNKKIKYKDLIKVLVDTLGQRRMKLQLFEENEEDDDIERKEIDDIIRDNIINGYKSTYEEYLKISKFYGIISDDVYNEILEKEVTTEEMIRIINKSIKGKNLIYDKIKAKDVVTYEELCKTLYDALKHSK